MPGSEGMKRLATRYIKIRPRAKAQHIYTVIHKYYIAHTIYTTGFGKTDHNVTITDILRNTDLKY